MAPKRGTGWSEAGDAGHSAARPLTHNAGSGAGAMS